MLKILSAEQIRAADAYTIQHKPIPSIDLMERAASAFCQWFLGMFNRNTLVYIFCGLGNNGGDGLAIARMLLNKNYIVSTCIVRHAPHTSTDFAINYNRLKEAYPTSLRDIFSIDNFPAIPAQAVIIDALFGTGLNKPIEGLPAEIIRMINNLSHVIRIAVDIPSGLHADRKSEGIIFNANYTFSFELPKYSFLLPENFPYVGHFYIGSIGLDHHFIEQQKTPHYLITPKGVAAMLRPRKKFDHKGTYGHVLLIGGSKGKMGAIHLAAKAALRTGCGLVTVRIPQCGYKIIQTTAPEIMVELDEEEDYLTALESNTRYTSVGIGPGLGTHKKTAKALIHFLEQYPHPLVLDADALNILATHPNYLHLIPKNSIITPHPKEFERLFGQTNDDYQRHKLQTLKASELGIYIILKGAHTAVACPDGNTYFNSTGNPGMATAGSGDVLTGIITSLLAQGYSYFQAAVIGVFLHGLAGDCAARRLAQPALIASDLIESLSDAYITLEKEIINPILIPLNSMVK